MATQRMPSNRKPTGRSAVPPTRRGEAPPQPPKKNNLPILLGGAGGGLVLLILLIVALSSGSPDKKVAGAKPPPKIDKPKPPPPPDVSGLESEGKKKTQDGSLKVQPRLKPDPSAVKENVRKDLFDGIKLLNEGIAAYEEATRRAGKTYPIDDYRRTRARAIKALCDDDLEREGLANCDNGLKIIQSTTEMMSGKTVLTDDDKKKLKEDLQKAVNLIGEGMELYDRSNQVSGHTFETNKYGQAMKLARSKILELK